MAVLPRTYAGSRGKADDADIYRMLAGHKNEEQALVPCGDYQLSMGLEARGILLLLPDLTIGLSGDRLPEIRRLE